jgi:hypothetical protein
MQLFFLTENSKGNPCCAENFIDKESKNKDIYRVLDSQEENYKLSVQAD